jgi:hypothetical protein
MVVALVDPLHGVGIEIAESRLVGSFYEECENSKTLILVFRGVLRRLSCGSCPSRWVDRDRDASGDWTFASERARRRPRNLRKVRCCPLRRRDALRCLHGLAHHYGGRSTTQPYADDPPIDLVLGPLTTVPHLRLTRLKFDTLENNWSQRSSQERLLCQHVRGLWGLISLLFTLFLTEIQSTYPMTIDKNI